MLPEPTQRFTSTTGLDEEQFGFSSQTRAIGPIEIVHNLFYGNGFSIRSVNASRKLNMARLQEENAGAGDTEGKASPEGTRFPWHKGTRTNPGVCGNLYGQVRVRGHPGDI